MQKVAQELQAIRSTQDEVIECNIVVRDLVI